MTGQRRTAIITGAAVIMAVCVVFSVSQAFTGKENGSDRKLPVKDSSSSSGNISFRLPDEVTFAGERMPLENFDTRESLEREILISAYRHSSTILIIKRANRYLPVIENILQKNNIPDDFKYLAAAESEFSNMISPAGATGFWQIMSETGKEEGMEINQVVDERYHIEKATQFACDYFRKSYDKYGNWTLAAASYNGGRNRIDEQIEIQHQKNYYDLLLAEETARYIFRVVAYKLIITNPSEYGFDIGKDDLYPPLNYYEVRVDTAIKDISLFAGNFGTNYKMLKFLNPWLRKPFLNDNPGKTYTIKIPAEGMRSMEKYDTDEKSFDREDSK